MNTLEKSLEEQLVDLGQIFRIDRVFLAILGMLGIAAIILSHTGVLPLSIPYVLFYLVLLILFGLYKPSFLWQVVVFTLPFETFSVALLSGTIDVRLYQLGIVALGAATVILWLQRKISLPAFRWFDGALALLVLGEILTFFLRQLPLENGKDILILLSFTALYGLGRFYLVKKSNISTFLNTLLASGVVVAGYALYQVIAFQKNWMHFMVMSGRPNSTLEEADWLGFFIGMVALIAIVEMLRMKRWYQELLFAFLACLFLVVLILSVSRSAWLGFGVAIFLLGVLLVYEYASGFLHARTQDTRTALKLFVGFPIIFLLALGSISIFSLTPFELGERLVSTGTGEQTITLACTQGSIPPKKVFDMQELEGSGCQYINLEEQGAYQSQGYMITEIERPDPNISIRKDLYRKSWSILRDHFFLGLGWGESVKAFGIDGRGAGLNSSNLFLEIWLGSGLIGLLGFLIFWVGIAWAIVKRILRKREMTEGFWLSILLLTLWIQVTVFNFFNAGLLSGVFLIFLMLAAWYGEKTVPSRIQSLWQK